MKESNSIIPHKWSFVGIILALFMFLFKTLGSKQFIDTYYFKGGFQLWRSLNDNTLSKSPIPLIYILFVVLFILLFVKLANIIKSRKIVYSFKSILIKFIGLIAWIFFLFYILWGLNYSIPSLKERLSLKQPPINDSIIYQDAIKLQNTLVILRGKLTNETSSLDLSYSDLDIEKHIRPNLENLLASWDIPTNGSVRIRAIKPSGVLLRIATAGIYLPFVSEGHIDAGLHPIQWPATMAHEMAHGYGVTDEGECNFVGILTCIASQDKFVQYSGYIMYYRYLAYALAHNEKMFDQLKSLLSPGVRQDLIAIRKTLDKYPDLLPDVRNWIYDYYLKSNGVQKGIRSYGTVVPLMQAYLSTKGESSNIK